MADEEESVGVPGFPPLGTLTPQQQGCELDQVVRWTKESLARAKIAAPNTGARAGACVETYKCPARFFYFRKML
jgi:hypothetical protein